MEMKKSRKIIFTTIAVLVALYTLFPFYLVVMNTFKNANSIPLVNFPSKDKVYESSQLWPFFASRLPGNAQLDADSSRDDIVTLLQKYGRHVITNPYVLAD